MTTTLAYLTPASASTRYISQTVVIPTATPTTYYTAQTYTVTKVLVPTYTSSGSQLVPGKENLLGKLGIMAVGVLAVVASRLAFRRLSS